MASIGKRPNRSKLRIFNAREVMMANRKTLQESYKQSSISGKSYYLWHKKLRDVEAQLGVRCSLGHVHQSTPIISLYNKILSIANSHSTSYH
ncbi:hypothetical protein SAMN05421882_10782 [Nitrosomonas communis]|uniref:Transposase n=1 Tax=Nitrosomonas communis TaxID=44574 RepID=A0A1H2ZKE7_9PROT|nr:hypothetical protein SAMN05421882_10782 [Nitrosomonas communis]